MGLVMNSKEKNDLGLTNPDGKMQGVFESRNNFTNDSKNFVQENNTADVKEQEYVPEQFVQTTSKPVDRGSTTTLNTLSGFWATTAVAVASTVVIAVAVVVATVANFQLFATTSDSLTFYVQGYLNEDNSYIVRLYNDKNTEEYAIKEPFIQFYGLMPETTYAIEVVDTTTDEVVLTQEFSTAPQDSYGVSFEAWIEDGAMLIKTFQDSLTNVEGIEYYTLSIYDAKGTGIFEKSVISLDEEYSVQLPTNNSSNDVNDPNSNNATTNPTNKSETYYVGLVYKKGNHIIGSTQSAYSY